MLAVMVCMETRSPEDVNMFFERDNDLHLGGAVWLLHVSWPGKWLCLTAVTFGRFLVSRLVSAIDRIRMSSSGG